jgi:hypothetical protein
MVRIGAFALTRKGADFPQGSHGEKAEQTVNRGSVYKGSCITTGVRGPDNRYGPCAELSSRSDDRALAGAWVRLERRAVKVACVVLRGLGEGDLAWLPGALMTWGVATTKEIKDLRPSFIAGIY